jgi:cytochrome c biogenesis protein CcmG/thiol:disulfide interchange protein DsbE
MLVRPARNLRLAAIGVIGATALLAAVFATRFGRDPSLVPSPLIGRPAPSLDLPLLDGSGRIDPSQLEGKIIVVNFFASWCLQCRNEHPALVATAESFAGSEVQFIGIAYQDTASDALGFLEEYGVSPSTLYLADPGSRAAIAYGVFGIPETFFVSPEGIVVGKVVGESDALILGNAIDAIRRGERPGQQITGDTQQKPTG